MTRDVFARDFKESPYWWEDAPPISHQDALPPTLDVAIIGGGYAGLSTALRLANAGASVAVLEAREFGYGASTRSAGMISRGNYILKGARKLPEKEAELLVAEASRAQELVEDLISRYSIDCDYARTGRIVAAALPEHYQSMTGSVDYLNRIAAVGASMLPRERQRAEMATDHYFGGMLLTETSKIHPAHYFHGLRLAAHRAGARLRSSCEVRGVLRVGAQFKVAWDGGELTARHVVVATNGDTGSVTPQIRRRIIPVASYMMATEKLPRDLVSSLLPTNRALIDTRRILRFARMSPDGSRLLFGGRARFTAHPAAKAVPRLYELLTEVFPQLRGRKISHAWSGNVAFTFDDLPHAGDLDGIHFCVGCNGSGVGMMTMLGKSVAEAILSGKSAGPFDRGSFPTRPLYRGDPQLVLPLMGQYYRMRDWLDRTRSRLSA